MQANKQSRVEGVTISKGFVYGTTAVWKGPGVQSNMNQATHTWSAYVRGVDNADMSNAIRKVVFALHPSFENPTRVVASYPFEIALEGWGEFELVITIHLRDPAMKPLELRHMLTLYRLDAAHQHIHSYEPVVSEKYDELVFEDPPVSVYNLLMLPMEPDGLALHKYLAEEAAQVAQIDFVREHVNNEIKRVYAEYVALEAELKALRRDEAARRK